MVDISSLYKGGAFQASTVQQTPPQAPAQESEALSIWDFQKEAENAGLLFPGHENHPAMDGSIRRVPTRDDKSGNRSGWYTVTQVDGGLLFGHYGDWRRGMSVQWSSREASQLSWAEREAMDQARARAEQRAEEVRREAADRAEVVIEQAGPADPNHPYLKAKGVKAHEIYQQGDYLVIPSMTPEGEVATYQAIGPDGSKRFLKGGAKKGTFYWCDGAAAGPIYVAEGYATAATIAEATGQPCAVAWDAGNLEPVVGALRAGTDREIIIAADNDPWKPEVGNPGIDKAAWAARSHANVKYIAPRFRNTATQPTDWNDLLKLEGIGALRRQLLGTNAPLLANAWQMIDPAQLAPRQWLYGTHLIRGFVGATVSPGGVGKTTLALLDAISMATGRTLGHDDVHERARVWHFNLEDPMDELQRRVLALLEHFGIPQSELNGHLFLNSGRDRPLIIAEETPHGDVIMRPDVDALEAAIMEHAIDVLSVDPFVRSHRVNENSNGQIDDVMNAYAGIADRTGCAIDLVHHVSKGSRPGDMEAARGASALGGAARTGRTLAMMSEDDAKELSIPLEDRFWYVRIDDAKANMSPLAGSARWMQRGSVTLANGDNVGVLEKWKPKGAMEGVSTEQVRDLQTALMLPAGQDPVWRLSDQSADWVGNVIAEHLQMNPQDDKKRINKLIRTWIKSGVLECRKAMDHKRRERDYIVAGPTQI